MSKSTRVFLAIALVTTLVVASGTAALASAVYRAGIVEVDVRSDDVTSGDVSIRIPGFVIAVAASLVPAEALSDAAREAKPFLPAARAAFDELTHCPDGVYVEVESRGEHVRIGKKDGVFFVHVRTDGESVRVSLPLHAVGPVLARLESAARRTV
jgi:hypothetical protein